MPTDYEVDMAAANAEDGLFALERARAELEALKRVPKAPTKPTPTDPAAEVEARLARLAEIPADIAKLGSDMVYGPHEVGPERKAKSGALLAEWARLQQEISELETAEARRPFEGYSDEKLAEAAAGLPDPTEAPTTEKGLREAADRILMRRQIEAELGIRKGERELEAGFRDPAEFREFKTEEV